MTRGLLAFAGAVLAFTSTVHSLSGSSGKKVDAKADAQIHLYSFATPNCMGTLINNTPYELKQGQCVNIQQSNSVKLRFRPDHGSWVDEVNALRMHCQIKTFAAPDCVESNRTEGYRRGSGILPKGFEKCLVPRAQRFQVLNLHGSGLKFAGDFDSGFDNGFNIAYDSDSESSDDEDEVLGYSMQSAMFVCGNVENPEHLCTSTVRHTSWSMDSTYWSPHASVHTATYTGTLQATASVAARSVAPEDIHSTLESRMKPSGEKKGVWMYHPWKRSLECYLCYTKRVHDYRKVECRAGVDYPADCGAVPDLRGGDPTTHHTTTTSTTTAVTTTHYTSMTAYSNSVTMTRPRGPYVEAPDCFPDSCVCPDCAVDPSYDPESGSRSLGSEADLDLAAQNHHMDIELSQKKSWHTPVKFWHPFIPGREACADAEWEKRGRAKNHVKVQHIHFCDKKDRLDSQWIGLPKDIVHTESRTRTSTHVIPHTSTSTQTVLVTRRHDQL